MQSAMKTNNFQNFVLAVFLAFMVGYLLYIGRDVLLPILVSVLCVYVITSANEQLRRLPLIERLPEWAVSIILFLLFVYVFIALGGMFYTTTEQLFAQLPTYQNNLTTMVENLMRSFHVDNVPDWAVLWQNMVAKIDLQALATAALGSLGSFGSVLFLIIIYTMFMMAERKVFAHKISVAMPGESAAQTQHLIGRINSSIRNYLSAKTLVNVILAAISFVILFVFGVDFAVFWAIMIGLLNYIPYVGSLFGVALPVMLTLAQFGSLQTTLLLAALLIAAQTWVGNVLEPRMIGQRVNMSAFVVLISLTFWSAVWGIPGAILAVPLTSVISIILASFAATRPIAIMLADDVSQFDTQEPTENSGDQHQSEP